MKFITILLNTILKILRGFFAWLFDFIKTVISSIFTKESLYSIILSLIFILLIIKFDNPELIQFTLNNDLIVSDNEFEFSAPFVTSSSYFRPIGRVLVKINSPYIELYKTVKIEATINNLSYKNVLSEEFVELGFIDLNQVNHKILGKSYIPPQILGIKKGILTKEELTSFKGEVKIERELTKKDWIILCILFVSLIGTFHQMISNRLNKK